MDLVAEEDREAILEDRKRLIEESCRACNVTHFQCYGTSIWDETLYKAWSEIVTNTIPNISLLETQLDNFCRACDADGVVLFERATFLVISHAQAADISSTMSHDNDNNGAPSSSLTTADGDNNNNGDIENDNGGLSNYSLPLHIKQTSHFDAHRFEKISNIINQFKLSCGKAQSQFQAMQVRNSRFSAFIDAFTQNTYIMVIISNPHVKTAATMLNIQNARHHFEKFIPRI
jgi:Ras-related GTP-binding protein A/B